MERQNKRVFTKEHKQNLRTKFYTPNVNTKEFCYIIGVAYGDGSLFKSGYKYMFRLVTKDKDFAEKFKECLEKCFKLNLNVRIAHNKKYDINYFSVAIQQADVIEFLLKFRNVEFVKNLDDKLKIEVLMGLFDSEGSINYYKRIKNHKGYKIKTKELLIRIAQRKKSKGYVIIKYLLDYFKINYKFYEYKIGSSFNIWCHNALEFSELLDLKNNITIKRKLINLIKYKKSENKRKWTNDEVAFLINKDKVMTDKEIAINLNRTRSSIQHKLSYLREVVL